MHDGAQFELRNVPAVVVITEPFVGAGRAVAALDGLPDLAMVTLPHPTAELSRDGVAAAAAHVADEVAAILLGRAGEWARRVGETRRDTSAGPEERAHRR